MSRLLISEMCFFDNACMDSIHRVVHQTHGSCSQPLHLAHWCAMLSASTHMPVVQRSAGSHACSSVSSSVYLLPTASADSLTQMTVSLPAVTACCYCYCCPQHVLTLGVGGIDKFRSSVFLEKILWYYYIPNIGVADLQAPLNNMMRSS